MGITAVSGSVLASEISIDGVISWSSIPQKLSFYILLISTVALCIYQVTLSSNDRKFLKGITPKQYEAAIRNKVAEDVAKRSKKLIRDGAIDKLEKETEIFKKLYGEAK